MQHIVATQLGAAAQAGLLRPGVGPEPMAQALLTQITGHRLICECTDTPDQLPTRIAQMWATMLPLIATDAWLRGAATTAHVP